MDNLIANLSRRYADFEVWREQRETVSYEDSGDGLRIDSISKAEWAVRVFRDGRTGFAYVSGTDPDWNSVQTNLARSLDSSFEDPDNRLPAPDYTDGCYHETAGEKTPAAALREVMDRMREAALGGGETRKIERVAASEEEAYIELFNSRAGRASQRLRKYSAGIVVVAERHGEAKMEWDYAVNETLGSLDAERIGRTAAGRASRVLDSSPVTTGTYALLLENRAASEFLEILTQSFIGENVFKKKTVIADGLSFSPALTICDDPAEARGTRSYFFDGEGVGARRTCLVENGGVAAFLCDGFYGAKLGRPATGHAIRGKVLSPPRNGFSNVMIAPAAPGILDDAVAAADRAIGVVSLIGMHLVNAVTGELSVGFEGYLLERGNRVKAVSGVTMSGNLKTLFGSIAALGDDVGFYGQSGSPSLLVDGVVVSGV